MTTTLRATTARRPSMDSAPDLTQRRMALTAAIGLLLMAVLAPLANFGVLETLFVRGDATATVENIMASGFQFRLAIAAMLVVTFLDFLVAWALYFFLRPVNETIALLVGWLRLAAPAVFAVSLANLLDVARLLGTAEPSVLGSDQLDAQVMASIASFDNGWDMSLAIFGLHLVGLGYLLFRSIQFPNFLGALVVLAGGGYLADTFARILVPDFEFNISAITFVGEALLIVWLFWVARKGYGAGRGVADEKGLERPLAEPDTVSDGLRN